MIFTDGYHAHAMLCILSGSLLGRSGNDLRIQWHPTLHGSEVGFPPDISSGREFNVQNRNMNFKIVPILSLKTRIVGFLPRHLNASPSLRIKSTNSATAVPWPASETPGRYVSRNFGWVNHDEFHGSFICNMHQEAIF